MIVALAIAITSIIGGSALALLPKRQSRILGPIRTFGLTASMAVVLLHLLPEAYAARGGLALIAFVAALLAPGVIRSAMGALTIWQNDKSAEWVTLRITYVSLLVHSVADGVALAAYSGHMHHGTQHYGVLVALAAHTVPVVAVMSLTFRDFRGLRLALFGALGLLLATSAGVVGAGLVPQQVVQAGSAWVGAVVAGLLLHVVTHDLGGHPPAHSAARAVDLVAAVAGVGVGLLSGDAHSHLAEAHGVGPSLSQALVQVTLETAPMLLLGLCLAALLQTFGARVPGSWFVSRGLWRDASKGALVGIRLPLWSCGASPISKALGERRASATFVVAFLLAAPALGVETFALTVRFVGWEFAWLRLGGALVIAMFAAALIGALTSTVERRSEPSELALHAGSSGGTGRRLVTSFDELLHHIGAWMVLGIIAAAFVEALVPAQSVAFDSRLLALLIITFLTLPSYICAPSAIPLAAVLIMKGVSPGAVLVGLLLGPALNFTTLVFLKNSCGVRATVLGVLTMVAASWGLALAVDTWFVPELVTLGVSVEHHASWRHLTALLLVLLLLRSVWRSGTRAWVGSMLHGDAKHAHVGASDDSHGHAHGS